MVLMALQNFRIIDKSMYFKIKATVTADRPTRSDII